MIEQCQLSNEYESIDKEVMPHLTGEERNRELPPAAAMALQCPVILFVDENGIVEGVSQVRETVAPERIDHIIGRCWLDLFSGMQQDDFESFLGATQYTFSHGRCGTNEYYRAQYREKQTGQETPGIVLIEALESESLFEKIARCENVFALGHMASQIAHEINNSLAIALAQMQMLARDATLEDKPAEKLSMVEDEIRRIAGIARNVLTHSREQQNRRQALDIEDVLTSVLSLQDYQLRMENIEVEVGLAEDTPLVMADETRLRRVLLNIIMNARQAMPEGGRLRISGRTVNEWYEIKISDTGCGIDDEHLDSIFEPFFTTKENSGGTGLGLSVSRKLIERMGGSLQARSEPGRGTTFIVRLSV